MVFLDPFVLCKLMAVYGSFCYWIFGFRLVFEMGYLFLSALVGFCACIARHSKSRKIGVLISVLLKREFVSGQWSTRSCENRSATLASREKSLRGDDEEGIHEGSLCSESGGNDNVPWWRQRQVEKILSNSQKLCFSLVLNKRWYQLARLCHTTVLTRCCPKVETCGNTFPGWTDLHNWIPKWINWIWKVNHLSFTLF